MDTWRGASWDAWYRCSKGFSAPCAFDQGPLRIERSVDGQPVRPAVFNGTVGGEINATGKIVYGYNLRYDCGTYLQHHTILAAVYVERDARHVRSTTASSRSFGRDAAVAAVAASRSSPVSNRAPTPAMGFWLGRFRSAERDLPAGRYCGVTKRNGIAQFEVFSVP